MTTCAFTGHRKIDIGHWEGLPEVLYNAISRAYDLGCRRFIAGGALGFDTEAARQVIRFRLAHPDVSLIIFVPYIDQAAAWSIRQQSLYDYIISSANEVKYISETYDRECMKRRNRAMAEECDLMIAYVCREMSGSGQTYRMAKNLGKEVWNIYTDLENESF